METRSSRGVDGCRFRRRDLPHWEIAGSTYFVTFRLANSLPSEVADEWRREHEQLRRDRRELNVDAGLHRSRQFRACYAKYDAQLDAGGRGPHHLKDPRVAELVVGALRFYRGTRYHLAAYVVMSNHVHLVMRPLEKPNADLCWGLDEIMQGIKSYTGKEANALLGLTGPFWQREYFDHRIRDEEEWLWYVDYTHQNPVRAGLCHTPAQWCWSSATASSNNP